MSKEADIRQAALTMIEAAKTGQAGDGKISVSPVEGIYRIRTGETDLEAI